MSSPPAPSPAGASAPAQSTKKSKAAKPKAPAAPTPVFGAAPVKKKRKRPAANATNAAEALPSGSAGGSTNNALNREALDERDDIDEGDLVPAKRYKEGRGEMDDGDADEGEDVYGDGGGMSKKGKKVRRGRALDEEYDEYEDGYDEGSERDPEEGDVSEGEVEEGEGEGEAGMGVVRSARGRQAAAEELVVAAMAEKIKEKDKKAKFERMALRDVLDADQAERYDSFTTAVIPPIAVKRIHREKYDQRLNEKLVKLLAGMAKIFVADVIELAKDLQPDTPDPTGPLKPYHLRLARSILEEQGLLPAQGSTAEATGGGAGASKKALFRR